MSQICVNNLTFSYEGSPDAVFENVSFTVDTSWKLGFAGRNGKGKTTFLRLLMGGVSVQRHHCLQYSELWRAAQDYAGSTLFRRK